MRPRTLALGAAVLAIVFVAGILTSISRRSEDSSSVAISVGEVRYDAVDVSMIRLIAAPQEYAKKVIRVHGYLNVEFEGNAVYLHEEDFTHALTSNALWIDAKPEIMNGLQQLSGQYVLLEGIFDPTHHGHLSLYSGALLDISRGDAWTFNRNKK